MSDIKDLSSLKEGLESQASEILGIVTNASKIVPGLSLEEKIDAVIAIRQIEEVLTETRREVNATLEKVEEHLCRVLVDKELLQFDRGGYRVYPSAEGFFNLPAITKPGFKAFYEWAIKDHQFVEAAEKKGVKRALKEVCESALEKGETLPPNVVSFVRARIKLRRME
jgi:hypothetical protein